MIRLLFWIAALVGVFFIKKQTDPQIEKLMYNLSQYELKGIQIGK